MIIDGEIDSIHNDRILLKGSGMFGTSIYITGRMGRDSIIKLNKGTNISVECTFRDRTEFTDCDNFTVKNPQSLTEKFDVPKEYSEINIKSYDLDQSNAFRADEKYLNKRFVFKGPLSIISSLPNGMAHLMLGSFVGGIGAEISSGQEKVLSQLVKGETVTVLCLVTRENIIIQSLAECKVYKGDIKIDPSEFASNQSASSTSGNQTTQQARQQPSKQVEIQGILGCEAGGGNSACSILDYSFPSNLKGQLLAVCAAGDLCKVNAEVDNQNRVIGISSVEKIDKSTKVLATINVSGYFRRCEVDDDPDGGDMLAIFFDSRSSKELSLHINNEQYNVQKLCNALQQVKSKPLNFTYKIYESYFESGQTMGNTNILDKVEVAKLNK